MTTEAATAGTNIIHHCDEREKGEKSKKNNICVRVGCGLMAEVRRNG